MIPVRGEGVRRNFTVTSAFLYSVSLIDESGQRLLLFGLERHEALPIVAALTHFTLPRPETIHLMAETLTFLNCTLEEARIESHSMLPPLSNLCEYQRSFRTGEIVQEQTSQMRPGDVMGLALLMDENWERELAHTRLPLWLFPCCSVRPSQNEQPFIRSERPQRPLWRLRASLDETRRLDLLTVFLVLLPLHGGEGQLRLLRVDLERARGKAHLNVVPGKPLLSGEAPSAKADIS